MKDCNYVGNKKILYIITKSNLGGAQKYVYDLASEAKRKGFNPVVAFGGTGTKDAPIGPFAKLLEEQNIRTHYIRNFVRDILFISDINVFGEIFTLIRNEKPDVLHITSSKAGGIGSIIGRLLGVKKIIFTSHGLAFEEFWRPAWQRILIRFVTWLTIMFAHDSIMISTATYERAMKMPFVKNKIELIFNGIHPIQFHEKAEARKILLPEISSDDIWIGGIGELHPNKNWSVGIEAMVDAPKNTRLVIIGAGEEHQKLETLIQEFKLTDRVTLVGFIKKDAATLLRAFDIFILPSQKEGLPYVLLEAGLAKCAVVCSDISGNRDIITQDKTGEIIIATPKNIKVAIQKLIDSETLREKYGKNLQELIQNKFSPEVMYEKTFSTYT